ncbi:MAG: CHC2 zinc finger domain-containing protein [Salinivirgaceae bacterium]|jgi:DNA primase|nr:CHC2 zinc finger domain-containing protein [Salinivirgaceae bacterium]
MQIPDIKKNLPITTVLAHYGIKIDKNSHIKCPFHKDEKPSCKIYLDTNTYNCFGCGKTGDQIQFIQDKENCSKHQALKKATELIGTKETNNTDAMGIAAKRGSVKEVDFAKLFSKQKESLPRSPKALEYLKSRGLSQDLEIGYNSGIAWKKLKQCVVFPLKDKSGNIVSMYGRRVEESAGHKLEYGTHFYSENRKGLYPAYPPQETETLIITEAIVDAASLLQIEELNQFTILSAYGSNGLTTEHKAAIKEWASSGVEKQEIIFFFDGDTAGRDGASKYAEELKELLPNGLLSVVEVPDGEDVNSLFVNYGKEAILQLVSERQPSGSETPKLNSPATFEPCHPETLSPLNTEQANKIIYETQTARYIVKGSLPKTFDKMVISLDVQDLETATKYRCRLDLYEEKQTRKEARQASEKLELRSDLVENDLSQLTDLLEEYRDNQLQQTTEEANNDKALSFAEQAKCKEFLSSSDLVTKLNELVGKAGIVGEENNRLFLFVIATSHKMPDTLHALIQGSSGSGKTH